MPDDRREIALGARGGKRIAGLDEVGRGPWAGPVVAAAVVLPRHLTPRLRAALDDSKRVKPALRLELAALLSGLAEVSLGRAEVAEIDTLNILQASHLAMQRALAGLALPPDAALVDGNRLPELPCPAEALIGGDGLSLSIAAASIVAKVARDREMAELAEVHPGYGWERNAGYGTAEHRSGLQRLGPCTEHRRSFKPIRRLLEAG
ncbi:ribonuclease HII [Algihabitans albus]|uniref:ribonuclease HII n=1 Tax=Algihabitans albus TaxID=2164067 RepID=UPI000E5CF8AF|nr:ribonuclease HII [Algihabitans albus]